MMEFSFCIVVINPQVSKRLFLWTLLVSYGQPGMDVFLKNEKSFWNRKSSIIVRDKHVNNCPSVMKLTILGIWRCPLLWILFFNEFSNRMSCFNLSYLISYSKHKMCNYGECFWINASKLIKWVFNTFKKNVIVRIITSHHASHFLFWTKFHWSCRSNVL